MDLQIDMEMERKDTRKKHRRLPEPGGRERRPVRQERGIRTQALGAVMEPMMDELGMPPLS